MKTGLGSKKEYVLNAKTVQIELKRLLSAIFGKENVYPEWRSNARAQDWLRIGTNYAPRPDIAVGPFNIEEGRHPYEIEETFKQHRTLFDQLGIENTGLNKNPRCLIAIEIENSNKGKHMLGNIINASLLGKIGIVVTLRVEFYLEAERIHRYLKGAFKRKKLGHEVSNVVIVRYERLKEILQNIQQKSKFKRREERRKFPLDFQKKIYSICWINLKRKN